MDFCILHGDALFGKLVAKATQEDTVLPAR